MGLGMQQRQVEGAPLVYHMDKTEGAPSALASSARNTRSLAVRF